VTDAVVAPPGATPAVNAGLAMALSETLCGEPCASSVMVKVAVRWPGPIGLNATKIVQFPAGAIAAVQLLVKLKSEGLGSAPATEEMWRGAFPELVMVNVCGVPVVSCVMVGKEGAVGERVRAGTAARPAPFRTRVCGLAGALSATSSVANNGPALVGEKSILTEQFEFGASVAVQVFV